MAAANETKPTSEEPKMDLFEDDDEFEEFEIDLGKFSCPLYHWLRLLLRFQGSESLVSCSVFSVGEFGGQVVAETFYDAY